MKKILISLLVLVIVAVTFSISPSAHNSRTTFRNAYAWGGHVPKDKATLWAQQMENAVDVGQQLGTGQTRYVDSGATGSATGLSWDDAVVTLNAAVDLCTADRGDFILVAQGHNEDLVTADAVDLDVAGITVKGIGNGSLKPTFDYTARAAEFVIGASNVRVENIRHRISITSGITAIDIESGVDNAQIIRNEFGYAETSTDEWERFITVNACDNTLIQGCYGRAGGNASVYAIYIASDVVGLFIDNNRFFGDFSTALIADSSANDNIEITNNILFNGTTGGDSEIGTVAVMVMTNSTSGYVGDNRVIATLSSVAAFLGDDMVFVNNFHQPTDGDEFNGGLISGATTVTISPSSLY